MSPAAALVRTDWTPAACLLLRLLVRSAALSVRPTAARPTALGRGSLRMRRPPYHRVMHPTDRGFTLLHKHLPLLAAAAASFPIFNSFQAESAIFSTDRKRRVRCA